MKLILFFVISCLALQNRKGAPTTAVYKFVICNPDGNQANCMTQQSPKIAWRPDLPAKLPASTAQNLEAEPVEDESPQKQKEETFKTRDNEDPQREEQQKPEMNDHRLFVSEQGSGSYEGSAPQDSVNADDAFMTYVSETGSGVSETAKDIGLYTDMRHSRAVDGEPKPAEQELKEDHLLQL